MIELLIQVDLYIMVKVTVHTNRMKVKEKSAIMNTDYLKELVIL